MKFRIFSALLILLGIGSNVVFAQDLKSEYDKKTNEIKVLEAKLAEITGQVKTLSSQITKFDAQIHLTELKIEQTSYEIDSLSHKIGNLESAIGNLSSAYQNRANEMYRLSRVGDPMIFLLGSQDISSLLTRLHYLRKIAQFDRDLLIRLQTSQTTLEFEKDHLERLQKKLEEQTTFLSRQKDAKQKFLELTRNDEKKYQELLQKAKSEQAAIAGAMRNAARLLQNGQAVKKGDIIGLIGNSGVPSCSTGPHLHLEIQKDGVSTNPAGFLLSRDVIWDNAPDSTFAFTGSLEWPIDSPRITQGYGITHWASTGFYSGKPHTGIDMTSSNPAIRAPVDGTLYKGTVTCGTSPLNFVALDHGGDLLSWYWHVQ